MKALGIAGLAVCLGNTSHAALLVKDPFVTGGAGSYTAGSSLAGQSGTNSTVGLSGSWGTGTGVFLVEGTGLAYPAGLPLEEAGGSLSVFNASTSSTDGRILSRTITGLPTSGSIYYSALVRAATGLTAALADGHAVGVGIGTLPNSGTITNPRPPDDGIYFAFQNIGGTKCIVGRVKGVPQVLVANPVADQTYICVAKIEIGAGSGGQDIVRLAVDPVVPDDYDIATTNAVLAAGTTFTKMAIAGTYRVNSKKAFFDEVRVGSTWNDVCPLAVPDLMVLSTSATGVDDFSATANASLVAIGENAATVLLDWGTSEEALSTTTNLGVFTEAGSIGTILDDLTPATTYFYRHRAEDGQNVSTSLVTIAFTTTGAASFSGLEASNILSTAFISASLDDPGVGPTAVSLWFGPSEGALSLVKIWDPTSTSTNYAWSIPDCTLGATYHYAFKAEYEHGGDTYAFWSSTNAIVVSADMVWTGAGADTAWGTGANWDLGMAPLAVSTATIAQGASVTATGDGVANVLQVNATAPVSIDFTGHSLAVPTVHVGTKTTSGLTLKGNLAVNTLLRIGDASASGSTVVLEDGAALGVGPLQVGYSSANNVLRVLDGASLTATSEALVLSSSGGKWNNTIYVGTGGVFTAQAGIRVDDNVNAFIIDGGTVTNSGTYYNGRRKTNETSVGARLDIVNGGFMRQVGTLHASPWYRDRVRVMNGGVLQAGAITIGSDQDSGTGSLLIVSNATVTASSLGVPSDDRHTGEGVMIYEDEGRTTTVAISGGMNLGVYNSTRPNTANRNNLLNIYGGSLSVSGAFTMGNTKVAAHSNNVVRVLGGNAAFSADSLIACNYSRLEYAIPAEGFDTTPIQVAGTATLDPTTAFNVDATAFVQGGMVTLLSAGTLVSTMPDERVVVTAKAGYTSTVLQEDNAVKVRIVPSATILIVR